MKKGALDVQYGFDANMNMNICPPLGMNKRGGTGVINTPTTTEEEGGVVD